MAATASYIKKLSVSDDDSAYEEVNCTNGGTLNMSGTILNTTNLETNAGFNTKIQGLNDWSVSFDALWEEGHDAYDLIMASFTGRTALYVKMLFDGTNGYKGPVVVESINHTGEVNGLNTYSCTLQGAGAFSAV